MANKTAENAVAAHKRTHAQAQETLRGKNERIDEMARLTRLNTRCFREELIEALAGPPSTQHRSVALRILDWGVFDAHQSPCPDACCDICNPEFVTQLRAGTYILGAGSHGGRRTRRVLGFGRRLP